MEQRSRDEIDEMSELNPTLTEYLSPITGLFLSYVPRARDILRYHFIRGDRERLLRTYQRFRNGKLKLIIAHGVEAGIVTGTLGTIYDYFIK